MLADRIGVNALSGGLLVGLAVPVTRELADLLLDRLRDVVVLLFLPVFFAVSGLVTDLRLVDLDLVPGLLLFLFLLVAAKWGPAYLACRATGLPRTEAHAVGVLLTCGGVLVLVVGIVGLELETITQELQAVFVLAALVTLVLAGPLVDRFLTRTAGPMEAATAPCRVGAQPD